MSITADKILHHNTKYHGITVQEEVFGGVSEYFLCNDWTGSDTYLGFTFPNEEKITEFMYKQVNQ